MRGIPETWGIPQAGTASIPASTPTSNAYPRGDDGMWRFCFMLLPNPAAYPALHRAPCSREDTSANPSVQGFKLLKYQRGTKCMCIATGHVRTLFRAAMRSWGIRVQCGALHPCYLHCDRQNNLTGPCIRHSGEHTDHPPLTTHWYGKVANSTVPSVEKSPPPHAMEIIGISGRVWYPMFRHSSTAAEGWLRRPVSLLERGNDS